MLRLALSLLAASTVQADKLIKTSALLPCQKSTQFSANRFDVTFFPDSSQIVLDVEISSAIDGNFSVDVEARVYGIKVFSETISGCSISKTICPISPGRFDVQTSITVPDNIVKRIPGIAYRFPDIDAVFQAKVYYVDASGSRQGGSAVACVVARLSNGKTVQHGYVSWILFGIIMCGVVVSGFASLAGHKATASHIISNTISLFSYFQATAIIGMMAVARMPPISAAWVQNFEWTMGIISVKFMQNVVSWYVRATGGTVTTVLANKNQVAIAVYKRALQALDYVLVPRSTGLQRRSEIVFDSNTTTKNERDPNLLGKTLVLQGIERVSYLASIEISNFFTTGAAFFIFIGIAIVFLLLIVKGILEVLVRTKTLQNTAFNDYRINYRSYTKGTLFRYFLVGFTQLSLLCLWEFTMRESAATVIIASVMFAILLISLSVAATKVITLGYKSKSMFNNPASILYGNPEIFQRWGFLYYQYSSTAYYFLIIDLAYNFSKSAVISLGQNSGKVQSVVFFVIEVSYFIVLCVVHPYMNKRTNVYNIAISVFSIVNAIFYMFFSQLFGDKAAGASAIIGVVYFILNAVLCFVYLILIIVACLLAVFHPRPDTRYQPVTDDRNLFMPDVADEKEDTELDDMRIAAGDGYGRSYLAYDPKSGEPHVGVYFKGDNRQRSDTRTPETALRNTNCDREELFPSYRDMQSRGVLADRREVNYKQDTRLI